MDNGTIGVIVLIVVVIIVFAFLMITFLAFGASDPVLEPPTVTTNSGGFLAECTTTPCQRNLLCDGTTFTCKLPEGSPCQTYSECVYGLICSGLCATGVTGGLNQLCPCNDGYSCVVNQGRTSTCKAKGGTSCTEASDCVSSICTNGICADGAPNSYPCTSNDTCASRNCNNGFCQSTGITTGTVGSACAQPCFAIEGAVCASTPTNPLTCQCNDPGGPGICITANQGILSGCSTTSACSDPLLCYNQTADLCSASTPGECTCIFPYNDPNVAKEGISCINGMTVGTQGICNNDRGLGCDIGGLCSTNQCGGQSVMATYIFEYRDSDLGTIFPGATTTSIVPAFSGPSGLINPSKMFATSNGTVDTIYLVDKLQGLLSVQYDVGTGIATSWVSEVANVTDASYNGETFVVVISNSLYYGADLNNLTSLGIQYRTDGTPLTIEYVDISVDNDILISSGGTVYVKAADEEQYSIAPVVGESGRQMTGTTGPAYFYYDVGQNLSATGPVVCPAAEANNPVICPSIDNIAFVSTFQDIQTLDDVLQFSGNLSGQAMPIDRFLGVEYNVFDYSIYSPVAGMQASNIIALTQAYDNNGVFINNIVSIWFGGNTTVMPYRISTTSRSVASANAFYILSIGSCT